MKTVATKAIVLKRIDYAEADRIITFLTPDMGQARAIAKGVRKPKSRLAGGIELLSICDVVFMDSRGDLKLLRSARIDQHFGNIVKDFERMQAAYKMLEASYTLSSSIDEPETYEILKTGLTCLNDFNISLSVTQLWFVLAMLVLMGQQPNLQTDEAGRKLQAEANFSFDQTSASFSPKAGGAYTADHIKTARLLIKTNPLVSAQIKGIDAAAEDLLLPFGQMFERVIKLGAPG